MTDVPSLPIPENAARRDAITRAIQDATGLDDAALERLVRAFYARARRDAVIGHLFDGVHDWEGHIERIATFWSSVALLTGRYHGQPLSAHVSLGLKRAHFVRWLELFEETARELCDPSAVALLMEKARRVAASFEMAIAVSRGDLPRPRGATP